MKKILHYILIVVIATSFVGCYDDEKEISEKKSKEFVRDVMSYYYLWPEKLPQSIDLNEYETPEEVLEASRYEELDRWSFLESMEDYNNWNSGDSVAFGFRMYFDIKEDETVEILISYVVPDSPADLAGLKRGDRIVKIEDTILNFNNLNDLLGESVKGLEREFTIVDRNGLDKNITIVKGEFVEPYVPITKIVERGDKKIGYLLFNSFTKISLTELKESFTYFKLSLFGRYTSPTTTDLKIICVFSINKFFIN